VLEDKSSGFANLLWMMLSRLKTSWYLHSETGSEFKIKKHLTAHNLISTNVSSSSWWRSIAWTRPMHRRSSNFELYPRGFNEGNKLDKEIHSDQQLLQWNGYRDIELPLCDMMHYKLFFILFYIRLLVHILQTGTWWTKLWAMPLLAPQN